MAFAGREGFEFVEISSIVYAQAEGAYTHVFMNNKRKLVISKRLSDIEEMLPANDFSVFITPHWSTLIMLPIFITLTVVTWYWIALKNLLFPNQRKKK